MIAALFVEKTGVYSSFADIELWDQSRDARRYAGPHRVIAHPPCSRWCRLAGLVEARWGYKRGEDDGCFESALESVRRYGGVLEHPAYSDAWAAFGLNRPPNQGGWVAADFEGGWTCYVEQGRYGHPARKATWLYAHSVELGNLRWGVSKNYGALVSWCSNNSPSNEKRPRVGKSVAARTPQDFAKTLIRMVANG